MTELDSTKANPTFPTPRIPKDSLGNARLARTRETQSPTPPDLQTATWEPSRKSE